jgi:hypothetical protein
MMLASLTTLKRKEGKETEKDEEHRMRNKTKKKKQLRKGEGKKTRKEDRHLQEHDILRTK